MKKKRTGANGGAYFRVQEVLQDQKVRMENLELKALPALEVSSDLKVPRVMRVHLDFRVILGSKATLASKASLANLGRMEKMETRVPLEIRAKEGTSENRVNLENR